MAMEDFVISIDRFEGPLDLMLHLIREKKMDLFDLDVSLLCDQYIAFIHANEERGLTIAAEYLSELAGLIEMKSNRLLPKRKTEEEIEEDPREKLIQRLIEYQKFKDISQILDRYQKERSVQFTKTLSYPEEVRIMEAADNSELKVSPYDLMKAMNRCLRRLNISRFQKATYSFKEYDMQDISREVENFLKKEKESVSFWDLIKNCTDLLKAISIFLCVLEMIYKKQVVYTLQQEEIYLKWSEVYA